MTVSPLTWYVAFHKLLIVPLGSNVVCQSTQSAVLFSTFTLAQKPLFQSLFILTIAGRILITGCNDINIVIEAINRCEVFRFLTKPWVKDDLTETIQSSYHENVEKQKENLVSAKLVETNQQLEFMLRQKLIS